MQRIDRGYDAKRGAWRPKLESNDLKALIKRNPYPGEASTLVCEPV
jgi:hypothetical protein